MRHGLTRMGGALIALAILPAAPAMPHYQAGVTKENGMTAGSSRPAADRPMPRLYLLTYRPGPAWEAGKPLRDQDLGEHSRYMYSLLSDGRLFAAGPIPSIEGGMAIVSAGSEDEAREIVAADPGVVSGLFVGDVTTWLPLVRSQRPLIPEGDRTVP